MIRSHPLERMNHRYSSSLRSEVQQRIPCMHSQHSNERWVQFNSWLSRSSAWVGDLTVWKMQLDQVRISLFSQRYANIERNVNPFFLIYVFHYSSTIRWTTLDTVSTHLYSLDMEVMNTLSCVLITSNCSIPTALMTAELSTSMPENGGYVVWTKRAFGPFWGFQVTSKLSYTHLCSSSTHCSFRDHPYWPFNE